MGEGVYRKIIAWTPQKSGFLYSGEPHKTHKALFDVWETFTVGGNPILFNSLKRHPHYRWPPNSLLSSLLTFGGPRLLETVVDVPYFKKIV